MALKVDFKINERLAVELKKLASPEGADALVVVIGNEEMQMSGERIAVAGDLQAAAKLARAQLYSAKVETAFVVVKSGPAEATVVIYSSSDAKPKERMLYAAGTGHLQESIAGMHVRPAQATSVADIDPRLFNHKQTDEGREALMTESERMRAEIAKMEIAPQPTALPGVCTTVDEACLQAIQKVAHGALDAITVHVNGSTAFLDKEVADASHDLRAITQLLPADHPRYIVMCVRAQGSEEMQIILAHVCPPDCKPREKMPYALSKASFINQLSQKDIKLTHRVEVSDAEEFESAVEEIRSGKQVVYDENKPAPPRPVMSKGPRMLI